VDGIQRRVQENRGGDVQKDEDGDETYQKTENIGVSKRTDKWWQRTSTRSCTTSSKKPRGIRRGVRCIESAYIEQCDDHCESQKGTTYI